jgi:hypothetical protein
MIGSTGHSRLALITIDGASTMKSLVSRVLHYWPSWSLPIVRMSFPTKKCDLDTPKMRGISACRIVGILDKTVPTDPRSLPEANEGL